jgi:predicted membrane-bound dolichyl-phosphate-mannose-protein mannosyltransferase
MCTVALGMVERLQSWALRRPRLPVALIAALAVVSLGVRLAWIAAPCYQPCAGANAHLVIFDEDYYVNAARVIAGIRPPSGVPYAHAPLGTDPNAEHPPLAKLIMAGSIELFGNQPIAWRLGSLLLGTLAILGMYALVRAVGGSRWLALGAAALMAADNLFLVHGRIATLDVYALTAMIWGATLYLRRLPLTAGIVIGVGACAKEVTPYVLLVLAVLEAAGWVATREDHA